MSQRVRPYPLCAGAAAWVALCWPLNGLAQPLWQDLEELQRAAEAFARTQAQELPGRVEIEALPLDPETRLARCESLQTTLAPDQRMWGDTSVAVRCAGVRAACMMPCIGLVISEEEPSESSANNWNARFVNAG